jgi:hypothetical protein
VEITRCRRLKTDEKLVRAKTWARYYYCHINDVDRAGFERYHAGGIFNRCPNLEPLYFEAR